MTERAPSAADDVDCRFKQIEFFFKYMETRSARHMRMGNLIILGNAGAIATCSVIIKDLKDKVDEQRIILGAVVFVVGLVAAGIFSFLANASHNSFRAQLFDLVLNPREDIQVIARFRDEIDGILVIGAAYSVSLACLFIGIVIALRSLYQI